MRVKIYYSNGDIKIIDKINNVDFSEEFGTLTLWNGLQTETKAPNAVVYTSSRKQDGPRFTKILVDEEIIYKN